MKRLLIILLILSYTAPVLADDVKTIPPGDDRIVPVKEGDKAPFTGQLYDTNTALRWANWIEQYQFKLKVDVEVEKKKAELEIAAWQNRYKLQQDQYTVVTRDLQLRLEKAEGALQSPPWYQSTWFGFSAGVVLTGLAVGLGAFAFSSHK